MWKKLPGFGYTYEGGNITKKAPQILFEGLVLA